MSICCSSTTSWSVAASASRRTHASAWVFAEAVPRRSRVVFMWRSARSPPPACTAATAASRSTRSERSTAGRARGRWRKLLANEFRVSGAGHHPASSVGAATRKLRLRLPIRGDPGRRASRTRCASCSTASGRSRFAGRRICCRKPIVDRDISRPPVRRRRLRNRPAPILTLQVRPGPTRVVAAPWCFRGLAVRGLGSSRGPARRRRGAG